MKHQTIPIHRISPDNNPREAKQEHITKLAASIRDVGLLNPILVTPKGDGFTIVAGHCRYAAMVAIGAATIDCRIIEGGDHIDAYRCAIVENTLREQMTFAEQADAIHNYAQLTGLPPAKAGEALGIKQAQVSKCLKTDERLTPANKKKCLEAGLIGSVAYHLSQETDPQAQTALVDKAIKEKWTRKQIEAYFRAKRASTLRIDYRMDGVAIQMEVPKTATLETIHTALKNFLRSAKGVSHLPLDLMAKVLREQSHVAAK